MIIYAPPTNFCAAFFFLLFASLNELAIVWYSVSTLFHLQNAMNVKSAINVTMYVREFPTDIFYGVQRDIRSKYNLLYINVNHKLHCILFSFFASCMNTSCAPFKQSVHAFVLLCKVE